MSDEQKQVTSVEGYKKIFSTEPRTITLPSGAIFKIKQVDVISLITGMTIPIGYMPTNGDGKEPTPKSVVDKLDVVLLEKQLIVSSVVEPPLSVEKKDGFLALDELSPSDRVFLTIEVTKLHGLDRQSREVLESFRQG